jgi:glutamate 5-kinase
LSPTAAVKGVIYVDDGAVMAVSQRGRSLLAAGIVSVTGEFEPHNLISIVDSLGTEIARGMTTYGSTEVLKIKGLHSTKISSVLGFTRGETVIHHHNMILI